MRNPSAQPRVFWLLMSGTVGDAGPERLVGPQHCRQTDQQQHRGTDERPRHADRASRQECGQKEGTDPEADHGAT